MNNTSLVMKNNNSSFVNKKICCNCGLIGHYYKKCKEPTISIGVICIKLSDTDISDISTDPDTHINPDINPDVNPDVNPDMNPDVNPDVKPDIKPEKNIKSNTDINLHNILLGNLTKQGFSFTKKENTNTDGINVHDHADLNYFLYLQNKVEFLMISRKHSFGFLEFVRGKYKESNTNGIIFLFRQMTSTEISSIKVANLTNNFDSLWKNIWSYTDNIDTHNSEYITSTRKFNNLKNKNGVQFDLNYYINHVNPDWSTQEWGFPKGRKNITESTIECADREFQEESGLKKTDYILLKNIAPFSESFLGTNGINYKHIYYVALLNNKKTVEIDNNNRIQTSEIGDIGCYNLDDALKMIRPYHKERKSLISKLHTILMNKLILLMKKNII